MITYRDYRPADYASVIDLWRETGLPLRPQGRDSRSNLEALLAGDNPRGFLLLAWDDVDPPVAAMHRAAASGHHGLMGTVLGSHDGRKGWINRLAVRPSHQGRGYGRHLVARAEDRFRACGIEVFAALVEHDNAGSLSFFAHLGYTGGTEIVYVSRRLRPYA